MGLTMKSFLLSLLFQFSVILAVTNDQDRVVLTSFRMQWKNTPLSWRRSDPCDGWEGINCTNKRVVSITLSSIGLMGSLDGDIEGLSELQILDLSNNPGLNGTIPPTIGNLRKLSTLILTGCKFFGPIPETIGSLQRLRFLDLNSNRFSGHIPPSIGNLSILRWLDLAHNELTGTIPVSDGSTSGLDLLTRAWHFHFGENRLSGPIPGKLFSSNMTLRHLVLEGNQLNGSIPRTLGLVETLKVVRLDRNSLSGSVPSNLNNLKKLNVLHLSNNALTGPIPNLTGMNLLSYVDLSNNTFDTSEVPPWFSTLQLLTTLLMEDVKVRGQLPKALFTSQLQTLNLKNNQLNGTLDIGFDYSEQLQVIDLQNNSISGFVETGRSPPSELILVDNPVCAGKRDEYCMLRQQIFPPFETKPKNCTLNSCSMGLKLSPNCSCSYPFTGILVFRAVKFSDLQNSSYYVSLEQSLMDSFRTSQLPVDSVSFSNPIRGPSNYLNLSLDVFPSGKENFDWLDVASIGFTFGNQTFVPPDPFIGPYFFISIVYVGFAGLGSKKSTSPGIIIGVVAGVVVLLLICAGVYAILRKRKTKEASWKPSQSSGTIPQLKGARCFTFEELQKCTNNFSEANGIGSGGYGKVYRGLLASGQLVAIKRSMQGSMQGALEFKTEIELLSRLHHKNLVSLVGFCFEQGEQILVYEYVPNGTLKESLSGESGIRMDWKRRLQVAVGSARGLVYLHELANPPVIHRDIKSNNILLDDHLNAKVADFGLSKLMGDSGKGHVTTQVKGTLGYMDPEYYSTEQLTEKSDVYSYGVVMLEFITARRPIERGRYIVREMKVAMDKTKDLYGLSEFLDPIIVNDITLGGFEKFVELAMRCVEESGMNRPKMREVVKGIETVMQLAGLNPNDESASTSECYEGTSQNSYHPYSNEPFDHSVNYKPSEVVEPH